MVLSPGAHVVGNRYRAPEEIETMTREERAREFEELQDEVLRLYGVAARSRFVELDKPPMRAHVLEAGDGEPLVVLHGGDGEAVTWAPLMGVLQKDARIHAVDRPGFGLSDAFDYRTVDLRRHAEDFVGSLLDALGVARVTLVGSGSARSAQPQPVLFPQLEHV
jgi:hypothetical protein